MTRTDQSPDTRIAAFCLGVAASFVALTALHETVLRSAGHVPAIVDDEPLWCIMRQKVDTLGKDDILLLGASRMQTDIDEATLTNAMPGRRIVNLAISGGGTSLPVFRDIVHNTRFAGLIIFDETEYTMASDDGREQAFVDAYARACTFDRLVNRKADTWLQCRLVCLGPGESCTDLWPRVLARGKVPPPKPTVTNASRYTRSDYSLVDPALLEEIRRGRLQKPASTADMPVIVDAAVARWADLVTAFRARGGRVIFVRLPVSRERWELEDAHGAASRTWQQIMERLQAPSILCNGGEANALGDLRVMDHSHVDLWETKRFTAWLGDRLRRVE